MASASARGILSCGHTHGAWKKPRPLPATGATLTVVVPPTLNGLTSLRMEVQWQRKSSSNFKVY